MIEIKITASYLNASKNAYNSFLAFSKINYPRIPIERLTHILALIPGRYLRIEISKYVRRIWCLFWPVLVVKSCIFGLKVTQNYGL